ncbi:MAG TPA: class I SAM-dependent methyltransferase [Gemmatimonadaceae bacterium]|nr:class I SAM-dependent methyltransferase [Gemmatimonadaceae bacterium]
MRDAPLAAAPRRTGDEIRIPGDYQHRARTSGFVVQRYWHYEKERMIRRFAQPVPGERVLDVGCGSGVITNLLAELGATATGVDGSADAIAYARETFQRPNLQFVHGLVDELDFPDASFDRVYCFELIEHLYAGQGRDLLRKCRDLTRPGGMLALTTPNYRGVWPAIEWLMDTLRLAPTLAEAQHVAKYTRSSLAVLLSDVGWRIQHLTTFSTVAPFMSVLGWRVADAVAEVEESITLPFGSILFAVARAE